MNISEDTVGFDTTTSDIQLRISGVLCFSPEPPPLPGGGLPTVLQDFDSILLSATNVSFKKLQDLQPYSLMIFFLFYVSGILLV